MPNNIEISLILNVLFFSILGLGLFFGYIKGAKKSLYSLIVKLVFYVLFFVSISFASKQLYHLEINNLGSLLGGQEYANATTIKDIVEVTIRSSLEGSLQETLSTAEFSEFVDSISIFVIKMVYTVVYFTIFQLIYNFIFWIIRLIFIRNKPGANKHRLLGATFGFLRSSMTVYVLIIFLGGFFSMVENVLTFIPRNQIDSTIGNIVDDYNNNIIVYLSDKIGKEENGEIEPYSDDLFDMIFSIEYREKKIHLRKEIDIAADIYRLYLNSTFYSTKNISDITTDNIEDVFKELSKSDLLSVILPLGITGAADYLNVELDIDTDLYAIPWQEEIEQIGEIAKIAFRILSEVTSENVDIENYEIPAEEVKSIFEELSESQMARYGTLIALRPIMESISENFQAVVSLPRTTEEVGEELRALASISYEIFKTRLTIRDIKSGNPTIYLTALSQMELSELVKSSILSNALIKVFEGDFKVEGLNIFVVPEDVVWLDENRESGELVNILNAIKAIALVASDVDFNNLKLDVISKFSDNTIDEIFNSRVIVATLSSIILDLDIEGTSIILPNTVLDDDGYLKKEELSSLATSARVLVTEASCDIGNETCQQSGIDFNKLFGIANDSEKIGTILNSNIIAATIGKLVMDQDEILVIPKSVYDTEQDELIEVVELLTVKNEQIEVVSKEEIINLFKVISIFEFENFNSIQFDTSIIHKLADEHGSGLDPDKEEIIFASHILHASLSKMLLDLQNDVENTQTLKIPYKNEDGDLVRIDDTIIFNEEEFTYHYIAKDELISLINVIISLDISDFKDITGFSIDYLYQRIDTLLNSAIIHATISDLIISLDGEQIDIPENDIDGDPIRRVLLTNINSTTVKDEYIIRAELDAFFEALQILELNEQNIDSFNADALNLKKFYIEANQDAMLNSAILHATISKQILNLDNKELTIPDKWENNKGVIEEIKHVENDTIYISKNEIKHLLEVLEVLNIEKINDYDGAVSLSDFNDRTKRETLLNSAIIHAKISEILFDLHDKDILKIPNKSESNMDIRIGGTVELPDNFVIREEILDLLDALYILGYTDVNNEISEVSVNQIFTYREEILQSTIIQATISYQMLNASGSEDNLLLIPDSVRIYDDQVVYIELTEINAILDALNEIGITNTFDNIDLNNDAIFNSDLDILLASKSIQASISNTILHYAEDESWLTSNIGEFALIVPNYVRENVRVDNVIREQIEIVELKALLYSLQQLGFSSFEDEMDDKSITHNYNEAELLEILDSNSIHLTMDNLLRGNEYISIPDKAKDDNNPIIDVTKKEEIVYFILSITEVVGSNSDGFAKYQFQLSTVLNKDPNELNYVVKSMIVRNTLTQEIREHYPLIINNLDDSDFEDNNRNTFLKEGAFRNALDIINSMI